MQLSHRPDLPPPHTVQAGLLFGIGRRLPAHELDELGRVRVVLQSPQLDERAKLLPELGIPGAGERDV